MSFAVLSSSIFKLGGQSSIFRSKGLLEANKRCLLLVPSATIKSKAFKAPSEKPAPFPYKKKNFTLLTRIFDKTSKRLDENSKIILVEGPVAVGKSKFAQQLACDLDMHYIPDANMDIYYIQDNGFDLRTLDNKVPASLESFDEKKFCRNPRHMNSAIFQIEMYRLRYSLYIDALAHVLSTGQGVVIERSPWSDKAFLEAMTKNNFMSKNAQRGYYELKRHTIPFILRPHLVVYLDAPVATIKENIKKRNLPHEQNSPALTDKFLQDIEDVYKTDVLTELSEHAELLMYDWSEEGDVEAIVEDIERIDFGSYSKFDKKSLDWFIENDEYWGDLRHKYADKKSYMMSLFNIPFLDAPELLVSGEDTETYNKIVDGTPEMEYAIGFNPRVDTGLLFKTATTKYVKF